MYKLRATIKNRAGVITFVTNSAIEQDLHRIAQNLGGLVRYRIEMGGRVVWECKTIK